jgi:hypothetical protein
MNESLVWLYAITDSSRGASTAGVAGLAGAPLRVVESAGLSAVVSTVDSAAFGEQALRRNLEDLDWVTSVAHTHDAVIRAVATNGAVVPLRLASIYSTDEHVHRLLNDRRAELCEALRFVSGRTEWGVKVFAAGKPDSARPKPAASGIDYVRRRRAQLSAQEQAQVDAHKEAQAIHVALASCAVAARTVAPRNTPLSERPGREVLNGAYLVDDSRTDAFHRAYHAQEQDLGSVRLALTGPWPPYSFTTLATAPK